MVWPVGKVASAHGWLCPPLNPDPAPLREERPVRPRLVHHAGDRRAAQKAHAIGGGCFKAPGQGVCAIGT